MTLNGDDFEEDMEEFVKTSGYTVLPSRKFSNDHGDSVAPKLESENADTVTPDIYVMQRPQNLWVECKMKSEPLYYTKGGYYEHGIDAPKWFDYQTVQNITGETVWIHVYEQDSGLVLASDIDSIELCGTYSTDDFKSDRAKYNNEMVYFKRDELKIINIPNTITDLNLDYQQTFTLNEDDFNIIPNGDDSGDSDQSGIGEFGDD